LRADSRRLRREQTPAEGLLWQNLRAKRLNGAKFRRQHAIGDHIVDFCSLRHRLVVEVDSSQHEDDKDEARTKRLEAHGFKVIRFWNDDVLRNLDGVLTGIADALRERESELGGMPAEETESQS
jgi:very-short-patch-repair endonuclease